MYYNYQVDQKDKDREKPFHIYVKLPESTTMTIDCGLDDTLIDVLYRVKERLNGQDVVFLTEFNKEHPGENLKISIADLGISADYTLTITKIIPKQYVYCSKLTGDRRYDKDGDLICFNECRQMCYLESCCCDCNGCDGKCGCICETILDRRTDLYILLEDDYDVHQRLASRVSEYIKSTFYIDVNCSLQYVYDTSQLPKPMIVSSSFEECKQTIENWLDDNDDYYELIG